MAKRGKLPTDIKAAARVHTDSALHVLAKIMTSDAPPAARVAACIAILNRGWGQPHQSVDLTAEITTTKVIRTPTISPTVESWMNEHGKETLQ